MDFLIKEISQNDKYKSYCKKITGYDDVLWKDLHQEFLIRVIENINHVEEVCERKEQDVYFWTIIHRLWNDPDEGRNKLKKHKVGTSPFYQLKDNERDLKDYFEEIKVTQLSQGEKELREQLKKELENLLTSDNEQTREQGVFLKLYTEGFNRLEISRKTGKNYRIVHEAIEGAIGKIRARVTNKTYMTKTEIQITLRGEGVKASYSGKDRTFYVDKMPATGIVKEVEQAGFKLKKND